ncbi:MAG: hypothetical protein WKG00_07225 [Polyangiaceae bacterium]
MRRLPLVLLASAALGCGTGPYGYSRAYQPLDAEAAAANGATEYDPVMAQRQPEEWLRKKVTLFGVVEARADKGGATELTLSVRKLEGRNACETSADDSCRTTVGDHEFAVLRARITMATAADASGPESIGFGSLVRVVGSIVAQRATEPASGPQVLDATYYRHWPRGYYRTTADKSVLRR